MEEIIFNGNVIKYNLIKKKIRNMYMRFNENGILTVSAPKTMSKKTIESFIKDKIDWIIKQQNKSLSQENEKESTSFLNGEFLYFLGEKYKIKIIEDKKNSVSFLDDQNKLMGNEKRILIKVKKKYLNDNEYIKRFYEEWLKKESLKLATKYVELYVQKMKKYKIPEPEIIIKKFKAKWGCCIPKKKVVEFSMNLIKTPAQCFEYVVVHELAHFKFIYHNSNFYDFVSIFIPDWKERRNILNKKFAGIIN